MNFTESRCESRKNIPFYCIRRLYITEKLRASLEVRTGWFSCLSSFLACEAKEIHNELLKSVINAC